MMTLKFFITPPKQKYSRNERNLIESFKLPRILNSLKFTNYLIQTHYNGSWEIISTYIFIKKIPTYLYIRYSNLITNLTFCTKKK